MGSNQTLNLFCIFLLIVSIATALSSSSTSSHDPIQPKTTIKDQPATQYQVFYLKNTPPFFLDSDNHDKNRKMVMRKRKNSNRLIKKLETRPFSVMLPKGYVPPSASSPCHNDKPNFRVVFYCDLATTTKP